MLQGQEILLQLLQRYASGERNFSSFDFKSIYRHNECLVDINLSSANLAEEETFPTCLMNSILINANLDSANLEWARLHGVNFINASLQHTNLRNTDLSNAELTGAVLIGADLSGANLDRAKLIGANLTNANLSGVKGLENTICCQTIMPNGSVENDPLRVIDTKELIQRYEDARYEAIVADFRGVILHRIDLSKVNLQLVNFNALILAMLSYEALPYEVYYHVALSTVI